MNANEAPQCSTLRRHWEAMQATSPAAAPQAAAAPTPQAAAASAAPASSGGGFFAWLKSLFS